MIRGLKIGSLFLFISIRIFSQNSDIQVSYYEIIAGKYFLSNTDIKGEELLFTERIFHSHLDSLSQLVTIQLRGLSANKKWLNNTGNILVYDIPNKKIKWQKELIYNTTDNFQINDGIIQSGIKWSSKLLLATGEKLWEVKKIIYYVEPDRQIGLGYDYKNPAYYERSNILKGINLNDGSELWSRQIDREYGWNNIFHLNDSVIILVSSGIHTINLNDGKGWDFDAITGDKDYSASAAANTAGLVLGVLTGVFAMTSGHNIIGDVISNVIVDSSKIYFASKNKISCLDLMGNLIWTTVLPKNSGSKSSIFIKDSTLYMINKGYAFMGSRQLDYGQPFIAAYNLTNGNQNFLSFIESKEQITSYDIQMDTIIILNKDQVSKYSLAGGGLLFRKTFEIKKNEELSYFIGEQVYFKLNDTTFQNLVLSDTTKYFVFTKNGKILVLNNNLEIANQIDFDKIFVYYLKNKEYKFLAKEDSTFIVNKEDKIIGVLKATSNSILINSKLYDMKEKKFVEIDLKEVFEN